MRAAATTSALSLGVALGAVAGALLLDGATDRTQALVLTFAAAALLWLVVEELLVEAHERTETPLLTTIARRRLHRALRPGDTHMRSHIPMVVDAL